MSIRVKLLVLLIVLVLFSTGFIVTAGVAMIARGMSEAYSAVATTQLDKTIMGAIDLLAELKYAERHAPERLLDTGFLDTLSSSSDFYKGGLAAKVGNNLVYSKGLPEDAAFYQLLVPIPDTDTDAYKRHHSFDEENLRHFAYKDKDYFFIDYSFKRPEGTVAYYFVADISDMKALGIGARNSGLRVLGLLLIIIIGPLLWVISKDIIAPVRELEMGVSAISEGNLNKPISSDKKNELGNVIRYFDAMRIKLKGSIDAQIKMEENRKELLSSISHDLKTPITSIKGYVEGIRDGVANTPEKMERYLQVIYDKSLYLDALIDDLFLFSKLDLQKLPFDRQEVSFVSYFELLRDQLKRSLTEENQQLEVQWLSDKDRFNSITLQIDMRHMDRVFTNLLENSTKYLDPQKPRLEITLTANIVEKGVEICLKDNGSGISEVHLNRIFERFYRVDEARTSQDGTGLGLAISRQIVEQHGGQLSAKSMVGKGTCMCILLPYREGESTGDLDNGTIVSTNVSAND